MNPKNYKPGELAERAFVEMQEFFSGCDPVIRPSDAMWDDHRRTLALFEHMANRTATPKYYLNTMPVGSGKTTGVWCFAKQLLECEAHRGTGMLICVPYLREIPELVERIDPTGENIFVYTANEECNALGVPMHRGQEAQIAITTQQMIDTRLRRGVPLEDIPPFRFGGGVRTVRAWDESCVPWIELAVTTDQLTCLPQIFRKDYPEVSRIISDLANKLEHAEPGTVLRCPDLADQNGLYSDEWEYIRRRAFEDEEDASPERRIAEHLGLMIGQEVGVRRDNMHNVNAITWRDSIPDSMMPIVVLDASGQCKTVYDYYGRATNQLEIFTTSRKSYAAVDVGIMNIGTGKSSWRDPNKFDQLIELTAANINAKDEVTLVSIQKPDAQKPRFGHAIPDLEKLIREKITIEAPVHFLTVGNTRQTNDYRHVQRIVSAGHFTLPDYIAEARTRGAKRLAMRDELDNLSPKELQESETKSEYLQFLGRGSIRICDGEESKPCDISIMASDRSGLDIGMMCFELLPGCSVHDIPVPGREPPKRFQVCDQIIEAMDGQETLNFSDIPDGVVSRQRWSRDTSKRTDVLEYFDERGFRIERGGPGRTGQNRIVKMAA